MCWLKRDIWKAGIAIAGLLLLVLVVWVPAEAFGAQKIVPRIATTVTVQAAPTVDATVTALNKAQLTQQVEQQQHTFWNWLWSNAATILSSFLSILVVVIGVLFGFWQWRVGRKDMQNKESEDRRAAQDKELEDRKLERERRQEEQNRWLEDQEAQREKQAEDRFQKVIEGLGSGRIEAQVGAAIMLRTFLQPGYERFYSQTFDLAVAQLRLRGTAFAIPSKPLTQEEQGDLSTSLPLDSLSQALITAFKESFPRARNELKKTKTQFDPQTLDATGIKLDGAFLANADLEQAWLHEASLRKAYLPGAQLDGAHLERAQLDGAYLEGAQLEGANLTEANLSGQDLSNQDLQSAILWGANLTEANLSGQDLSNQDLRSAILRNANLSGVWFKRAHLEGVQLDGAHLERAQLDGAYLEGANPEDAFSLEDAKMKGVVDLTPEQQEKCIKKGAIFDDIQQSPASDTGSSSSLPPAQSDDTQVPSAPSAQMDTPTPDAEEGSRATSSQQVSES